MQAICIHCNKEYTTKASYNSKYCGNQCQKDFEYEFYIREWKDGLVDGLKGSKAHGQLSGHLMRYLHEKYTACCECGITNWCEMPITLEVEHIDGVFQNTSEANLILLCPNCHSQTDTYRAKNKGNGRARY
jgi:hypothetical protein